MSHPFDRFREYGPTVVTITRPNDPTMGMQNIALTCPNQLKRSCSLKNLTGTTISTNPHAELELEPNAMYFALRTVAFF